METAESKFGQTTYAGSGGGSGGGNTGGGGTGGSGNTGGGNTGGGTTGEFQPAILDISSGILQASTENAANKFTFNHAGGEITFVRANDFVDSTLYPNEDYTKPTTWKSGFVVLNETQIEVTRPYQIFEKSSNNFIVPENLVNVPFSMSFEALIPTPATSSDYLTSYADITIGNLRTLSGDVHRAKVFVKEQNKANAEFVKIGDFQLQPKNELRDDASATGELSVGLFYSQSVIDTHWISSSNTSTVISQNNQRLLNAALLKGSSHPFTFKTRNNFTLQKNEDYITSFDGYYNKVGGNAEIEVFITGSSLSSTNQEFSLGRLSSDPTSDFYSAKMANDSGSLQGIYNFFKTHQLKDNTPSTAIGFRVHSGEFHIANVGILPVSDRNFNPGFVKTRVPMPPTTQRGQRFNFVTEFYDFNNNKAQVEALTSQSIQFNGPPQVLADGTDATFSGSMVMGNSLEMYGVNPAYLRSIGYQGFDKTQAGTGERNGGFMLWSGSVGTPIGATETYNGVGLEILDASGSNTANHRFLQFASNYKGTGKSKFKVQTDEFLLGISSSANNNYISGSNGNLEISSSNFALKQDGDVILQGTITAAAGGTVGGWVMGTNTLSSTGAGGIRLNSNGNNAEISVNSHTFGNEGIQLGFNSGNPRFYAGDGSQNFIKFSGGAVDIKTAKFELDTPSLEISSAVPSMSLGTGQEITMRGGGGNSPYIALQPLVALASKNYGEDGIFLGVQQGTTPKFSVASGSSHLKFDGVDLELKTKNLELDTTNVEISSTQASMSLGEGKVLLKGGSTSFMTLGSGARTISASANGTDTFISMGAKGTFAEFDQSTQGIIMGIDDSVSKFEVVGNSSNYISFNNTALDLKAETFKLETSNLIINNASQAAASGKIVISGADQHIKVGTGISIDGDGDSNTGKITVGSGKVVLNGNSDSTIGGWTIGSSTISSNNLILNSSGLVETSTYVSGLKGFRLSAEGNGFLEVENARIRGTLKTTVFEKETVNAVGGQLQVGNATTITGSSTILAAATKIPVDNVSGFTGSEVIMAKRISNTGFQTEYMLITSHSFATQSAEVNPKDETNMSGSLFVVRGYSGSAKAGQVSSSLGGIASSPIDLEPGQVLVSTGFHNATTGIGSGYIRLNANPNDTATPFIDIVERTGSAIYDVDLKARLGDLSGISSAKVGSSPGFGLFSENVFLTGKITATSGEIGGFSIISNAVSSSNGNLRLKSNGEITGSDVQFTGGDIGGWTIGANTLSGGVVTLNSAGSIEVGSLANATATNNTNSGFFADSSGNVLIKGNVSDDDYIKVAHNGGIDIKTNDFDFNAGSGKLVIESATPSIALTHADATFSVGTITADDDTSGAGVFMDGGGHFRVIGDANNQIIVDGGNMTLKSQAFDLTSTNLQLNTSQFFLGTITSDSDTSGAGVFMDSGGHFRVIGDSKNSLIVDGGNLAIKTEELELDASSGNVGLHMSSSIGMIKAFSGSHDTAVTIVGKSGVNSAGALQVTQSGMPIFQAGGGENQVFASVQNMTMNSIPREDEEGLGGGQSGGSGAGGGSTTEIGDAEELIGRPLAQVDDVATLEGVADLVDAVSASAGIGIPTVRMATAVVGAQLSASRFNAGESMFLKNTKIGASKNTKFRVFISDSEASGAAEPPVNAGFDIRKVYKDGLFSNSHEIRQSMAFSSFIESADADARFVKNGATTGSAIYHFQNILDESSNSKWADGKFSLMRLDADTSGLNDSARRSEFVFLEARNSKTPSTRNVRVFQLQHDGEIVAAGDITGFGTSFMNVSDERLKQDIYNVTGSLNKILDLRPTHFTWKENKQEDVGFIAQEVEEVIPEVVQTKKGFINTDGEEEGVKDMKTISYPKLIPYLVDTIQELTKRIEELEKNK